jgi:predicted adenylyl cyclase CyaB
MKKNIEIEFKFQVLDKEQIENFLKNLNFIGEKKIVDIYLDTEKGDLYKKGVFIRIRNNKTLDFKFNLEDFQNLKMKSNHEHCDEYSFPLPLTNESIESINQVCKILSLQGIEAAALEELKNINNFTDSMIIDKVRKKYSDGEFEYSFDDIKELGLFLEIEAHASDKKNLEKIKEEMKKKIQNLKLKLVTTGYNELYWRKYNFELYKQGRYFLEGVEENGRIKSFDRRVCKRN